MKKLLLTTTTALALLAAPVSATVPVQEHPKEPEPPVVTERADETDLLLPMLVILGVALYLTQQDQPQNPPCITDQTYVGGKGETVTLDTELCE